MITLSLGGKYRLSSSDKAFQCEAVLPGSDFGNLIRAGLIENPMTCKSADAVVDKVKEKDFTFSGSFTVTKEQYAYSHAVFECNRLDTICKVYINGKLIIDSMNTHLSHSVEIKGIIHEGENEIKYVFSSPHNYIVSRQKQKPLPPNNNGTNGAAYLRKASCHFGWDWGPCIPYNYVGKAEILFFNKRITLLDLTQKTDEKLSVVTVKCENADRIYIEAPNGEIIEGENGVFSIENPELWWCRDVSKKDKQPLYTVIMENGEMTLKKKIGLRSVYLDMSPDKYGKKFVFVLNGREIFAKGANVIPFSAIPEYMGENDFDYYIGLCCKSNFNMLRIWGGGEYAGEEFLEKCDEAGIMIWQDLCFACLMYPFDDKAFLDTVLEEVRQNVRRISYHPCASLICGNNELEAMFSYLPSAAPIVKSYIEFFYHTAKEAVESVCGLSYIPTSPLGEKPFKGNSSDSVGDNHMWNVWHGLKKLDYYNTRYARFLSEFGLESLPSVKAVRTFAESETSLFSEGFMSHQKCVGGNEKMLFYVCENYSRYVDFEYLPYLTGLVQAECVKNAAEHFRRHRERCYGCIFWQLNDVWNAPSWSSVDFEKIPKPLMYKATQFFDPLGVSFFENKLYAFNDTLEERKETLTLTVMNSMSACEISLDINVEPLSSKKVCDLILNEGEILVVKSGDKRFIFDNIKKLSPVNIKAKAEGNTVTLTCDGYARNVCIESDLIPDDNCFSMTKGETRVIHFNDEVKSFRVFCENNIDFSKHRIRKELFKFLYRLKPMNIGNALYYEHN